MEHLIKLLPDHIANQIAAGEVVQRPASVVKELMENSIDAGADELHLVIKDAGKALIQLVDNGSGMSAQDARMCFERHATSKIRRTEDLFDIRTMGFRGEAMASIAAVAQVLMRTRLHAEELGTEVLIEGSETKLHGPCLCSAGTSISVKNLFFNVPARRNFLKSNPVEIRHILQEFIHIAVAYPECAFSLENSGTIVYSLSKGTLEERIIQIFGSDFEDNLIHVSEETPYVKIYGFIGAPETAGRTRGDQHFFVNRRFIKSHYLNHAVNEAFKTLIPPDKFPFYAIFLEIDPKHVDINIHPTKTEVKFDDERTIYQLLSSLLRKGLGNRLYMPQLPLDTVGETIRMTPPPRQEPTTIGQFARNFQRNESPSPADWEELFRKPSDFSQPKVQEFQSAPIYSNPIPRKEQKEGFFQPEQFSQEGLLLQLQNRYIVAQVKSGLVIIDQNHAHQRILFEEFLKAGERPPMASQQMLFPKTVSFNAVDFACLLEVEPRLRHLGFDMKEFGPNTFIVNGVPTELNVNNVQQLFEEIIAEMHTKGHSEVNDRVFTRLAKSIARNTAIQAGRKLDPTEMRTLVDKLFQCQHSAITPSGKPTLMKISMEQLLGHFA